MRKMRRRRKRRTVIQPPLRTESEL